MKKGKQIIITGYTLKPEQAFSVRQSFEEGKNIFTTGQWCFESGRIGYTQAAIEDITDVELKSKLKILANSFPFLNLGVTLMSGGVGQYNTPTCSFSIEKGLVKERANPHFGHPSPFAKK